MQEKEAVSDTLTGVNALLNMLAYDIMQSNNKSLRDTFVKYRNEIEDLQWKIYVFARDNGYYVPAAPAGQADIEAVRTAISGS